jgi:hypothetical protein
MKTAVRVLPVLGVCLILSVPAFAFQIYGDYVETRTADVWTGPCFANGEVGLTGQQATMAWKVRKGSWDGVPLDGLAVVAVTKANATLGDPYSDPYPAKSILIVDQSATAQQRKALADLAKSLAGRLLQNVLSVHSAPITMEFGDDAHYGAVVLRAGDRAAIRTRALTHKDHFCGNEYTYYPPLTALHNAMPAMALDNEYLGKDLGSEWRLYDMRSAFVGTFER